MNTQPNLSGNHAKGQGSHKNQSASASQNSQNNNSQKFSNKRSSQNTNNSSNNNGNNKATYPQNKSKQQYNGSKVFQYVRKIDTVEGKQELLAKQQQEEKIRQEEEEKQRQLMEQLQREEEEKLELSSFIQESIISQICADAESQIQQKKFLKSFDGLSYLLLSNFKDFEDEVNSNIPAEIIAFNEREYTKVAQENHNFRKRHQTSYNQNSNRSDEQQTYPNNQQYNNANPSNNQRMTVRQRLNTFNQNNAINTNRNQNNNYNNYDNQNQRNTRTKNNTCYANQNISEVIDELDSKWRQSRAPLFSQSNDELKFLLNVLTPDNFNNLKSQFYDLCQKDVEKCINSLINKVCKEAKYTKLYAQLAIYVQQRQETDISSDSNAQHTTFKVKMFQVLQEFFYDEKKLNKILSGNQKNEQEDESSQIDDNEGNTALSHQEIREKKRFQLFLKFLGELYLSKFLPKKIISYCIQTMFHLYVSGGLKAEDKNVEGIISLIESIGLEFENSWKNSPSRQNSTDLSFLTQIRNQFLPNAKIDARLQLDSDFFEKSYISFEGVMKILIFLQQTNSLSIRMKSLITNLMYRWQNKWEKALHQKEDPKTLQELHSQHYEELNKRQQEVYEYSQRSPTRLQKQSSSQNTYTNNNAISNKIQKVQTVEIDYSKETKKILGELDIQLLTVDECVYQLNNLGINNILQSLLFQFFDARLELLQSRYELMNSVLKASSSLKKQTFLDALNHVMNSLYSQACDFPHLNDSFISILSPLIMTGYLALNELKQTPCNDPDEDEDKTYFFQQFKEDCTSFLQSVNYYLC